MIIQYETTYAMRRFNQKLNTMSRRRFLEVLAGLGVSGTALEEMTQETLAGLVDDPKKEVPYVHSYKHTNHSEVVNEGARPEREPMYETVSRSRWNRIESAHDARQQLERRLQSYPNSVSVWVTTDVDGDKLLEVRLHDDGSLNTNAVEKLEQTIPDSVDGVASRGTDMQTVVSGIPVTVEHTKVEPSDEPNYRLESSQIYYWDSWSQIPAGAAGMFLYLDENDKVQQAVGTLGTPVDDNGTKRMVTAGHNIILPNTYAVSGTPPGYASHLIPDEFDFLGSEVGPDTFDGATLIPNDVSLTYELATNAGTTTGDIVGSVAEFTLKNIEDGGTLDHEELNMQGARTGRQTDLDITHVGSEGFRSTASGNDEGDSGGPYDLHIQPPYPSEDPYDFIAGIHQGAENFWTSIATSMYRIEEKYEVVV